jgi:putative lipoic acid-binding regulatory protein
MSQPERSAITYPCSYHLRVIVRQQADVEQQLTGLVLRHIPAGDLLGITATPSRAGSYTAFVFHLIASSQQQLEALYQELNQHELVKMSL